MTVWSRYLFGVALVLGIAGLLFAERLPEWWSPVSVVFMVLAAGVFLTYSIRDYRRKRSHS
ncbi:hypothetical protein [Microbacterium sp. PMB16]|uniref:hypothetical protein n=1 Tax=Microbacterium sp. PMB16 TaxID=3120157 RepID=UPI003F4C0C6A